MSKVFRTTLEGHPWPGNSTIPSLTSSGLDYDLRHNSIFFIHHNMTSSTLLKTNMSNFSDRTPMHNPKPYDTITKIQQIAYDFMAGNFYLLDVNDYIILCNGDVKYCRVITEDKQGGEPKSLALDPTRGYMYVASWHGGLKATIQKALMDGSGRINFVDQKVVFPYGITVDYVTGTIYWVDTYLDRIEAINEDMQHRRTIYEGAKTKNLYGISMFANKLYTTSWSENSIISIDLISKELTTVAKTNDRPFNIHVVHEYRQPYSKYKIAYKRL